ncbi:hypothetical protein SOVF_122720, partial [Spinacia oleracea]
MQRGRVRVLLKQEDGSLCNPEISSSGGQHIRMPTNRRDGMFLQ